MTEGPEPPEEPARTGFEDGSSPFSEIFIVDLGPRFEAEWRADIGGWDRKWTAGSQRGLVAYFVGATLAGGLAGYAGGGFWLALWWAALMHIPIGVLALSFLLFYGFLFERPSQVPIHTDASGLSIGGERWAWTEIEAVEGGEVALVHRTGSRIKRRPGLLLKTREGVIGWQVDSGNRDLAGLAERLETLRRRQASSPPPEKEALNRLGVRARERERAREKGL